MPTLDESWWVRVLAGPGGELHSTNTNERYIALPRPGNPRVVVDCSSSTAVRDAVERFVASRTDNSMVRTLAGRSSALLTKTKSAWSVAPAPSNNTAPPNKTLREHLCEVLGQEVRLSVAVGPPRPNRKPVIRCYHDTDLIAVAKLGPDLHTAAMVSNESHWLSALAEDPLVGVQTPAFLHEGTFGESTLLVMAAMDLESDLGLKFSDVPLSVVQEFSDRHRGNDGLRESRWWLELFDRLDRPELSSVVEQARRCQDAPLLDELEISAWHGDWSPWNMGKSSSGELFVWDWERTTIGVPVGFDLLHLHFQYGSGLDGADHDLRELNVPDAHHDLLKQLYLFEVCARLADAGVFNGERHTHAIDALRELDASGQPQ